ncbi:hypothetical protein [Thioalkalivibrio sulfidiphilus]|uniref:hypothetical protein n=1 Tax=Thioalkalivibrio sulfidiphilus TaxID=1033854 RepID=UPI003B38E48C
MRAALLLVLLLGLTQLAHAQFIFDPDITSNCGMECTTDADCDAYETDIKTCLKCMPQGVCGNPSCFDTCATSNSCPDECPICSFQQCVAPDGGIGSDGAPVRCGRVPIGTEE